MQHACIVLSDRQPAFEQCKQAFVIRRFRSLARHQHGEVAGVCIPGYPAKAICFNRVEGPVDRQRPIEAERWELSGDEDCRLGLSVASRDSQSF